MSERFHIDIVDDDAMVLRSLDALLRTGGYEVAHFNSAETFLKSAQLNGVGCVITDLRMPGMDGAQLQQRLLAVHSSLAVIIVTGHAEVPEAADIMNRGAVTVLEKPFQWTALRDAVEKALERSREMHAAKLASRKSGT